MILEMLLICLFVRFLLCFLEYSLGLLVSNGCIELDLTKSNKYFIGEDESK